MLARLGPNSIEASRRRWKLGQSWSGSSVSSWRTLPLPVQISPNRGKHQAKCWPQVVRVLPTSGKMWPKLGKVAVGTELGRGHVSRKRAARGADREWRLLQSYSALHATPCFLTNARGATRQASARVARSSARRGRARLLGPTDLSKLTTVCHVVYDTSRTKLKCVDNWGL